MKFSYHDTVKWHDTDANRRVRPSQILTYMQEAANLQMAANSRNLDRLRDEEGLAFLLSRISIRIYSQLHAYDPFDSETWIVDGHGAASTRCFRILREGEVMAEGVSLWALMNIREHRLLRASAFDHGFPGDEAISLPELPGDPPIPQSAANTQRLLGGILIGTSREVAAEYTFFLAVPVMFGASLLKIVKFGAISGTELGVLLVGMAVMKHFTTKRLYGGD